MYQWKQGHFEAATPQGRFGVDGLVYRGLGLECVTDDAGGTWYDDWDVTHIASGYRIGTIAGLDEEEAFKLATMLAEMADWTELEIPASISEMAPDLLAQLLLLSDLSGGSFVAAGLLTPAPRVTAAHSGSSH